MLTAPARSEVVRQDVVDRTGAAPLVGCVPHTGKPNVTGGGVRSTPYGPKGDSRAPNIPLLLLLFGSLLVGLGALLCYGVTPGRAPLELADSADPAEYDLRIAPLSPKVNFTSAEAPIEPLAPPPQPVTTSRTADTEPPNPPVVPPPPLVEPPALPPPAEPAPLVAPPPVTPPVQAAVIEVPDYLRIPHRGDTPMMRTWNQLGLPAILAAAFAAAPALGQLDGAPDKADDILQQLKGVNKSLKDLEPLKTLPAYVQDLDKKITELERKLSDQLKNQEFSTTLQIQNLRGDLAALRDQYGQLKQELDALRVRPPAKQPTTALYPPNGTGTGRLRLVNSFPQPVSIVVNNQRVYELLPNDSRYTDAIPAGIFSYEVLGIQERVSRAIAAGETYLIHVHQR